MKRRWWIVVAAMCLAVAYGTLLFLARSWQLGLVDAAIGDLRELLAVEMSYARANAGFSEGDLTRLPSSNGRPLSAVWARTGRLFNPGPPPDNTALQHPAVSTSSAQGFRAIADASLPEAWAKAALLGDGKATFCADARGYVCRLSTTPTRVERLCPSDCEAW